MCLRRARSHKMGISNIDFRTKKDKTNMAIFKPWQIPKFLGTMGYKCYKNPRPVFKKLFDPSFEINTQRDIVNDYPDPRFFTTAHFYKKNKMTINRKSFFNSEKVANLDESFKGKEIFNGDSMNIAEIMKVRKGKNYDKNNLSCKLKNNMVINFSLEDHKIQTLKIEKIIKSKLKKNSTAKQETQLVKINSYNNEENSVNLKKIEEIRNALRRRYGNRKNLNKVFKLWAKTNNKTITINDAYDMINSLFVPINSNEAKVFIASASNFGNEYLNYEEFSNLIHDPSEMNFDNNNKEILNKEKEIEKVKNNLLTIGKLKYDSINIGKLKDFITDRISILNNNIKELTKEKYSFKNDNSKIINMNLIDFNKFLEGILKLRPSDNLGKEEYIKKIFDEYKNKDGLLDMAFFGQKLYENNTREFMTKLKDKNIDVCKEQYNNKFNKLNNYIKENNEKFRPLYFKKINDLDNQILERKNYKDKKLEEQKKFEQQLNSTIPSTKWIIHVFKNGRDHFNYLNKVEHTFSPKSSLKQNNKLICNTRFSSVPPWKNTAEILVGDEKSSSYINEKNRFKVYKEISKEDKEKKFLINLRKHNRIKKVLKKVEDNILIKTFIKNERDIYTDMEKCKRIAIYNEKMKNRNLLVE